MKEPGVWGGSTWPFLILRFDYLDSRFTNNPSRHGVEGGGSGDVRNNYLVVCEKMNRIRTWRCLEFCLAVRR